ASIQPNLLILLIEFLCVINAIIILFFLTNYYIKKSSYG
ncbi:hypothetical protein LCGC14_2972170, partial [marine sediment metagenome]